MASINSYPQFMKLVNDRYSCRDFNPEALVEREAVMAVIDAARLAPSACNKQPWTFIAVTDSDIRARILAKSRPAFMKAPVIIVACGQHHDAWHRPADNKDHTDVDVSIAVEHLCIAASALGLATCWVCSFDVQATVEALGLPDDVEPIALIPLGYPASMDIPEKTRKSLDQILRWEKY